MQNSGICWRAIIVDLVFEDLQMPDVLGDKEKALCIAPFDPVLVLILGNYSKNSNYQQCRLLLRRSAGGPLTRVVKG